MSGQFFYLVSDGNTLAIWGPCDSEQMIWLLEQSPSFKIIGQNGGYLTKAEAEAERQRRLN